MKYNIVFTTEEIKIVSQILQEWPYKYVRPILENIWQQVDQQNTPKEDLTPKQD